MIYLGRPRDVVEPQKPREMMARRPSSLKIQLRYVMSAPAGYAGVGKPSEAGPPRPADSVSRAS